MRRKEKHIATGALIGLTLVGLIDIIRQWLEHKNRNEDFTWESYNGLRTFKNSLLGATVGAGVGYLVYEYKISREADLPFHSDEFLKSILTDENIKADPTLLKYVIDKRDEMKQWLNNAFGNRLVSPPEVGGSFHKRTANSSNYDLDIVLPFKRNSFNTLEEMYNTVYEKLGRAFGSKAIISKGSRAINVLFDSNGESISFDIVPGREINNYLLERDLNLYVRPDWVWQKGSSFKTNMFSQKSITVNKPEARAVIRLIKKYRDINQLDLPSVIIEQCVVQALSSNSYGLYTSLTQNLLNGMQHIAQKLEGDRLIDISNSNNNLVKKLTENAKNRISEKLYSDINKIEEQPVYLKEVYN